MLSDRSFTLSSGSGEARPRTAPTRRVEVITALLERYSDLVDPMLTGEGNGSTGVLLMPKTYTASVRELERILRLMRDDRHGPIVKWESSGERYSASPRRLWWHVNAWWIDVDRVLTAPADTAKRNRKNRGRQDLARIPVDQHGEPLRQVRVLRKAEARYQIALKGTEHIADRWGLGVEPMLPDELRQAA